MAAGLAVYGGKMCFICATDGSRTCFAGISAKPDILCVMDEKGCETMIIGNSAVGLSSNRVYSSFLYSEKESAVMKKDDAAALQISEDGKSLVQRLKDLKDDSKRQQSNSAAVYVGIIQKSSEVSYDERIGDTKDLKLELIERMLEALRKGRYGRYERLSKDLNEHERHSVKQNPIQGASLSVSGGMSASGEMSGAGGLPASGALVPSGAAENSGGSTLTRVTATQTIFSEQEAVTFAGTGMVNTADGRQINFNIELGLSQAFCEQYEELSMQDYICVDPLIINVGADTAEISDQKFLFDLDADGKDEEISRLGNGSGFLALDKNNDGIINDGSELFGTKSGDGFADLAAYDEDGNGWIDEADSVFAKLKVWSFDEDGETHLISLKEAGVGAVYLGNSSTQYHLRDEDNAVQAVIRKTGVFLKENGEAGTIQHVDFAV
ncbi:MAG: hypothetical protein ACI4EJ_09960 [Bacteroides sp.]